MLGRAARNLRKTKLRSPQKGRVTGLNLLAGEILAPSQRLFPMVATDEWLAIGNFREFEIKHARESDCATVYSMIDRSILERGVVGRSLPMVNKPLNWMRVAQRFPVRVRLNHPPERLVRAGAREPRTAGGGVARRRRRNQRRSGPSEDHGRGHGSPPVQ